MQQSLLQHIQAAFGGLWIQSDDHDEAIAITSNLCKANHWSLIVWDAADGAEIVHGDPARKIPLYVPAEPHRQAPRMMLQAILNQHQTLINDYDNVRNMNAECKTLPADKNDYRTIIVLKNPDDREIMTLACAQALHNTAMYGRKSFLCVICLTTTSDRPKILQHSFAPMRHTLPDATAIETMTKASFAEFATKAPMELVVDAARGLTLAEAEDAMSLAIVRKNELDPDEIWEAKTKSIEATGLLEVYRPKKRRITLCGMEGLFNLTRPLMDIRTDDADLRPKGSLLLGLAGSGKTQFAKELSTDTGRKLVMVNFGSLRSKFQGESVANLKKVLETVDAMAPCILFADEVEKGLAGAGSSGETDGGVGAQIFGTLLTWMNDHESEVMVLATCNDVRNLPGAFNRAERFDATFFFDTPTEEACRQIFDVYCKLYKLPQQAYPSTPGWTGAEIKSCCRMAAIYKISLAEAATRIVPTTVSDKENIESLREWAAGRCLSVVDGEKYDPNRRPRPKLPVSTRRSVSASKAAT